MTTSMMGRKMSAPFLSKKVEPSQLPAMLKAAAASPKGMSHRTVDEKHRQGGDVGGQVDRLGSAGGRANVLMSHRGEQQHEDGARPRPVEPVVHAHRQSDEGRGDQGPARRQRMLGETVEVLGTEHEERHRRQRHEHRHGEHGGVG